ncbi:MAG: hypothetical protein IKU03_07885 [Bacteroidales bacterium]|nr:hypothetical protein [Bacteroidales bacterium]
MHHQLFGWAKNKNGEIVCVSDVPRGSACNCFCPHCDAPLLARKGPRRKPHFAHTKDMDCKHGFEDSVHLLAKVVFQHSKTLCLPRFSLRYENKQGTEKILINNSRKNNKSDWEIQDNELIKLMRKDADGSPYYAYEKERPNIIFDEVQIEQYRGDVKPDAIAIINGHELFVEFMFSHAIDNEKYQKLKESKVTCVEVDLSNIALKNNRDEDFESMKNYLTNKSNIRWICYPEAIERIRQRLINQKETRQKKIIRTKTAANIDNSNRRPSDYHRSSYFKNDSISPFHENCEYIINRVEKGGEKVCDYVKKLRTLSGATWQDVHEGDRHECKMCPYHQIDKDNKVFCTRYINYL